jgi:hypothetical protein
MTDHLTAVFQHFLEHRDAIYELYRSEAALESEQRDRLLAYYDEFYDTITDEHLAQQRIRDACRIVSRALPPLRPMLQRSDLTEYLIRKA